MKTRKPHLSDFKIFSIGQLFPGDRIILENDVIETVVKLTPRCLYTEINGVTRRTAVKHCRRVLVEV